MRTRHAALLLLPAVLLPLRSDDFTWPGRGVISIDEPAAWSFQTRAAGITSIYLRAAPKSGANALLQITVSTTPEDRPLSAAGVKTQLLGIVQPQLRTAVEKSPSPLALAARQGSGWYVQLTDAALVGRPPVRGDYKVNRSALLALDEHTLAGITLLFDDPEGPEASAMFAMIESMRFRPAQRVVGIEFSKTGGRFVLTTAPSRVALSFPAGGLKPAAVERQRATASPGYFCLDDSRTGLTVSGWFEPAKRYPGLEKLWARDKERQVKAGIPAPEDQSLLKVESWEVVAYAMPGTGGQAGRRFQHLRASGVREGTWIDLHLSAPASATAMEELTAFLRSARMDPKSGTGSSSADPADE